MSQILNNIYSDVDGLFKDGFLDESTMREIDALCLPPVKNYTAEDIQRIRHAGYKKTEQYCSPLGRSSRDRDSNLELDTYRTR